MLIAWGGLFVTRVQAQTPTPPPPVIQGQVFNGTKDAPPGSTANIPVVIFQVSSKGPTEKTVNTDAAGKFTLTDVITNANAYFARVEYDNIKYFSEIVPAPQIATTPLNVTVYETQTVPADFAIERLHFILDVQPKFFSGLAFLQVANPGDRVFMIPLPLPAKYDEVKFQDTRDEGHAERLADGTILFPVMPDTNEILYNFSVPFEPPNFALSVPLANKVNGVNLLLSKTGEVQATGSTLQASSPFKSENGLQYLVYAGLAQAAGSTFKADISNLPGADNTGNLQSLILVAGGLGGLALLAYPVYRRRAAKNQAAAGNDHKSLVQAIARLDDAYARNEIDEQEYQDRRAALKAELLKDELAKNGT